MHFFVFNFTQFWLDGQPGNEYFLTPHKISGLLTPLAPLGDLEQILAISSTVAWIVTKITTIYFSSFI